MSVVNVLHTAKVSASQAKMTTPLDISSLPGPEERRSAWLKGAERARVEVNRVGMDSMEYPGSVEGAKLPVYQPTVRAAARVSRKRKSSGLPTRASTAAGAGDGVSPPSADLPGDDAVGEPEVDEVVLEPESDSDNDSGCDTDGVVADTSFDPVPDIDLEGESINPVGFAPLPTTLHNVTYLSDSDTDVDDIVLMNAVAEVESETAAVAVTDMLESNHPEIESALDRLEEVVTLSDAGHSDGPDPQFQ